MKRTYVACDGRKLYCPHRHRYTSHQEILEDIKKGCDPYFEYRRVCLPSRDDTFRWMKNLAIEAYRKKIQNLNYDQILNILRKS